MKKILTVLIAFILGNAMFAQKEIVPQKKSSTETYKILEKYKIAPTGNSYLFTDSIICELSGVVYHIKDDGKKMYPDISCIRFNKSESCIPSARPCNNRLHKKRFSWLQRK